MNSKIIKFNNDFRPCLSIISDVLLKNLDIHWFEYTRLYKTGNRFYLSNNQNWFEYFLKNNFQDDYDYNNILWSASKRKYTLWVALNDNKVLSGYFKNNMWNGLIYSFRHNDDYIDLFSFSTTIKNKHVNNLYINNTDIINKAIMFFKNEIYKKLPIGDDKFLLKTHSHRDLSDDITPSISSKMIDNFYNQTKVGRYYFNVGELDFYLTRMEFMCLTLMSHGNSVKNIANKCSISPRTVETHINSIKIKTGTTNRSGLISILNNYPFNFSKEYVGRI